jgi:hypothetical protein
VDHPQLAIDAAPLGQAVDVDGGHAPDPFPLGVDVQRLGRRLRDEDRHRAGRALEGQLLLDGEGAPVDVVAGAPAGGQRLGARADLPGRRDKPVVLDVEGGGSVVDPHGSAAGREALPTAPRQGDEAYERLVRGDVEAARVAGRGCVVRTGPADDGEGEAQPGVPPRPDAQARAEADPLVSGGEDLGRWSRQGGRPLAGGVGGPRPEVEGGGNQLAGAVERHLQAALWPAVTKGSPPLVRGDQPVREPPGGRVGGAAGEAEPASRVDADAPAQQHTGQLGGVAHRQRPDRAAPGQGGSVR